MSDVRVRIAPSPTGNLHVGTARTALFNYLFARANGGKFILRIEDTDIERSELRYVQNIFDSLRAIGIEWDEGPDISGPHGPYTQMQRLDLYRDFSNKLLEAGLAYYSYETPEELEAQRERAKAEGKPTVYRKPSAEDLLQMQQDKTREPSLRFQVPPDRGVLRMQDEVRGAIEFDTDLIGDFVIVKSNGTPTYNFAVVVDDILMRISHIIRGEDHISNTPKQILLYEAFAGLGLAPPELPKFAHVGMILAPDRSKLSKRHGATAVSDFIKQGYLPESFCNFLALLGWSPPDGEEVGSLEKFAACFTLDRIVHSPAIFEMDKLNWLNKQHLKQLDINDLENRARPYLTDFDMESLNPEKRRMMLDAVRERTTTLGDLPEAVHYFFGPKIELDAQMVGEVLMTDEGRRVLEAFERDFLASADFSSPEALEGGFKAFAESLKPLKTKAIMWPVRVALTGRTQGIDLSKTLYILGEETVRLRVESARRLIHETVS